MLQDLDQLVDRLRTHRVILAYTNDGAALAWRSSAADQELRRAIHNRRRGLARLMRQGDIRLCPSPGAHRQSWRYAGQHRYICEYCVSLDTALAHIA